MGVRVTPRVKEWGYGFDLKMQVVSMLVDRGPGVKTPHGRPER